MEPLNNDKQEKIADLELKNFEKTSVKTFTSKQSRHKNDIGNDRVYISTNDMIYSTKQYNVNTK